MLAYAWLLLMGLGAPAQAMESYTFVSASPDTLTTLLKRFPTPDGFVRVPVGPETFGHWLRELPVHRGPAEVRTVGGQRVRAPAMATVPLDLGRGDVQQCADSVLRLYAEYRWDVEDVSGLFFHFTSGDRTAWRDWLKGERFEITGATVVRRQGPPRADRYATYRAWLQHTFLYAGTRSLAFDMHRVPEGALLVSGDVLVDPGSPGHAVILLDVATSSTGERIALIGQGFMPAQTFHVLFPERGHGHGGWFVLPEHSSGSIKTPSWKAFAREEALRFSK